MLVTAPASGLCGGLCLVTFALCDFGKGPRILCASMFPSGKWEQEELLQEARGGGLHRAPVPPRCPHVAGTW